MERAMGKENKLDMIMPAAKPKWHHAMWVGRDACLRLVTTGRPIAVPMAAIEEGFPCCVLKCLSLPIRGDHGVTLKCVVSALQPWCKSLKGQLSVDLPQLPEYVEKWRSPSSLVLHEKQLWVMCPEGRFPASEAELAHITDLRLEIDEMTRRVAPLFGELLFALSALCGETRFSGNVIPLRQSSV